LWLAIPSLYTAAWFSIPDVAESQGTIGQGLPGDHEVHGGRQRSSFVVLLLMARCAPAMRGTPTYTMGGTVCERPIQPAHPARHGHDQHGLSEVGVGGVGERERGMDALAESG